MSKLKYLFAKIKYRIRKDDEAVCKYLRSEGVKVGKNCHIYSDVATSESYLIEIEDNVTISNGVQLITHDNSICKVIPELTDTFGYIKIGSNSFIGAKTVILRGVKIPKNTIIGAGSVVTKSFSEECRIIAGNPARVIGDWETYKRKYERFGINISGLSEGEKRKRIIESAEQLDKA